MSNMKNELRAAIWGAFSAAGGAIALDNLLDSASTRAVVLQAHLSSLSSPSQITEQAYNTAQEAAEKLASGDLYSGLFCAAVAGYFGGIAISIACRKEE